MKRLALLTAASAAFLALGGVEEIRQGDKTVRFVDCPKCPMRARLSPNAKDATLNKALVAERDRAALAQRIFRLMDVAADTKRPNPKRPLMGWSSWNTFGLNISDSLILDTAKAMATNGLKDAGYRYVNIDDGFFDGHDEKGNLKWNLKRFPKGMRGVVDGIHALGLKAGTYSDAGANTCGGSRGSGLYGHDAADCRLHFTELGFDFIKVDYCGGWQLGLDQRRRYTEISQAIRATGRPVHFNICNGHFLGTWMADVADSWRTTVDIRANWKSLKDIIAENLYLSAYARVGRYNDMDMLQVGRYVGQIRNAYAKEDTGLTLEEEATHFGMWCLLSSPLLIGCDLRNMPTTTLELVTNPYLLSMNQNDLGLQAYVVRRDGETYVLAKDADRKFGTARFVAFYNATDEQRDFSLDFAAVDLGGRVEILDLGERADIGAFTGAFRTTVPPHGARFYRLDAERRLDRTLYEAEAAYLSDYQELRDARKAGTAFPDQMAGASGGVIVRGLGGRGWSNDLIWRDVKVTAASSLSLVCATEADGFLQVCVDFDDPKKIPVKATGGALVTVDLGVTLTPGIHTVRLFNAYADMCMPDVDCLRVVRAREVR